MSVLTPPRLYFKGSAGWNPNTTNNNDQWPTYDFPNAIFNWDFLAGEQPPITPANFRETFEPWVLKRKCYPSDDECDYQQPPAEWNYYGGNNCGFRNSGSRGVLTQVSGGQVHYGSDPANPPVITEDPVVGQPVDIFGNPSPYASQGRSSNARLVDVNPDSFWSSQIYLGNVQIGDPNDPSTPSLLGQVPPGMRMHSRWLSFYRNLNSTGTIQIAGVGGCVFQIGLPRTIDGNQALVIQPGGSALLQAFENDLTSGARGVQLEFAVYTTLYFSSDSIREACPDLADCDPMTGNAKLDSQYAKLSALWDSQLAAGKKPSWNPAVSTIVGSLGIWDAGELSTMPSGRYISPVYTVRPSYDGSLAVPLSPVVAKLNEKDGQYWLSVDTVATIPEIDPENQKASFGTVSFGVDNGSGIETIGSLAPADYDRDSYDLTAGIVDFPLPAAISPDTVANGTLVVQVDDADAGTVTAMRETANKLTVQTDERGVYAEEGETGSCTFQVLQNGAAPTETVNVLLVQYLPLPPTPQANAGAWGLATAGDPSIQLVADTITVEPASGGIASFDFTLIKPGLPMVVFFPYFPGDPVPVPPANIVPGPSGRVIGDPNELIPTAFFTCVRSMPFDNALPAAFIADWNSHHDPELAWTFLYENVLYVYDLLYPVMRFWAGLNLGNRADTEAAWRSGSIPALISAAMIDSTMYMPVTRELSAGKRTTFELWGQLVDAGYPPTDLSASES